MQEMQEMQSGFATQCRDLNGKPQFLLLGIPWLGKSSVLREPCTKDWIAFGRSRVSHVRVLKLSLIIMR